MAPRILAIDQGTSTTKALLVEASGKIIAQAAAPLLSHYPHPGWAEQSALDIWASVQSVIAQIIDEVGSDNIAGIAIANQRETLVSWDASTSQPIAPAILWQCRRTADICATLHAEGKNAQVESVTGLAINPLFPAAKLGWIMENVLVAKDLAHKAHLRAGTVDSWLLWNLTGGKSFATDHSNASRTQLFDTGRMVWSQDLCTLFGAPINALPQPMPSDSRFGKTSAGATALPAGIPILAMMGDSHAALYGHGVREAGTVKATYGTGSSLMTLTPNRVTSQNGLSGTIAWSNQHGVAYALEGNITVSAQAASYMAQILALPDAAALSALAQTVTTSNGVTFVPALAGLGAPHWHDAATGTIEGLTHASTPAHLARATFEAIAFQIADVFFAMERDLGQELSALKADGGASSNDFLLQLQADILGRTILRGEAPEVGALGVAAMAFEALSITPLFTTQPGQLRRFDPQSNQNWRDQHYSRWRNVLARVRLQA